MAGKTRLAAKLLVSATVLASSGSGAYYYKTHGLSLPARYARKQRPLLRISMPWRVRGAGHRHCTRSMRVFRVQSPDLRNRSQQKAIRNRMQAQTIAMR